MSNALDRWAGLIFEKVYPNSPVPAFEWEDGHLRAARLCFDVERVGDRRGVPCEGVEAVTAVLEHSSLRELMVGIHLREDLDATLQPVVDAIAARPRPSLRSLALIGHPHDYLYPLRDGNSDLGDLGCLWGKLPALERLVLHAGSLRLGETNLPRLRTLEVYFTLSHEEEPHGLSEAHWPSLENVAIGLGDRDYGSDATVEDLARILERLPRLRNLAINGFNDDDAVVDWLSSSPLLRQLETLSLPGTVETAHNAEAVGILPAFRHLKVDAGPIVSEGGEPFDMNEWRRRF